MSTSKLFSYKMIKDQWYQAEELTDSDIAVVVDTNLEIFWFWEGKKSTARHRNDAREILGQLRAKYLSYRFKRVNEKSSKEVLERLEDLQNQDLQSQNAKVRNKLRSISRLSYNLSFINSTLLIITMIYIGIVFIPNNFIPYSLHLHYVVESSLFNLNLLLISILILTSFVLFLCIAIFVASAKKKILSVISLIGASLIFLTFYLLQVWDTILFYEIIGQTFWIRYDIIFLFMFSLDTFLVIGIIFGMMIGIFGYMNILIIRKDGKA